MQHLHFGIEFVITVVGGILTTGAAVFGIMRKISKFANSVENNGKSITVISDTIKEDRKRLDAIDLLKKDIDGIGEKVRQSERRIEGLNRDVMELSNNVLQKIDDKLDKAIIPISESLKILSQKSVVQEVFNENISNYIKQQDAIRIEDKSAFKEALADIKASMKDLSEEAKRRPCINHLK